MIVINNLTKSFGGIKVLDEVSLTVREGESLFVLGKSGVGKSVLLKSIVGLTPSDSGSISIAGLTVDVHHKAQLEEIRKKCGLVFQFPALLDSATVFENICFGLNVHYQGLSSLDLESKAKEKLALVGLNSKILSRFPNELSYGAQKRVSIARTLAIEPEYLLFDEPTTGMDPVVTQGLNQLIRHLTAKLKVTTVVVSHDIKSAFGVASRIILLESGKIVFDGTPDEFRQSTVSLAREFQIGI